MGVPNFYSWLIRRYPICLYQHTQTQQVDFLYLDMNQIIYKCATDARILFKDQLLDRHFEEVWVSIINYLDMIISAANPQQLIFLAFDGVAPRAKMNQQRQRRFQSQRRYKNLSQCLQSIGLMSTNQTYKNNQFSPGTEFMNDLNKQIKFYIEKKFQEDPKFKNLKCIFSGIDVPGEGEHKLLSYIRNISSKCNQNSVHMIYGADADLIMLGLLTQLKNVLIFREEMKLSKEASAAANRVLNPPNFLIINISMIRECLDLEFQELKQKMKIPYSIDRIIDDFILLCFFVGNDFLPRIYCFDIRIGTIEPLLSLFKRHLTNADEYIVDRGDINFEQLLNLLDELKEFEILCINDRQQEMEKYLSSKNEEKIIKEKQVIDQILDYFKKQENTEGRKCYYESKCEIIKDNELQLDKLQVMCANYVEGIQFVLWYYYKGVPSWEWYYKFYYAPLCADIYGIVQAVAQLMKQNNIKYPIQMEKGEPYPPFKQLLSILTPDNAQLLPEQYGKLLTDKNSILRNPIDYYPDHFETDSYGTMYDHQHITKIPFLDSKIIDEAYNSIEHVYDSKNQLGSSIFYCYDQNQNTEYESSLPKLFKNFKSCSQKVNIDLDNKEDCIKTLTDIIKEDANFVPTLSILKLKQYKLQDIPSRDEDQKFENQFLQIEIAQQQFNYESYIEDLDKNNFFIYCDFPILRYCQVLAIIKYDGLIVTPNTSFNKIKLLDSYQKKDHQKFYAEQQYQITKKYEKLGILIKPTVMLIVKRYKYLIRNNDNQLDFPETQYNELIFPYEFTFIDQAIKFIQPKHEDFQVDRRVVIFRKKKLNGALGYIKSIEKDLYVEITQLHPQFNFEYLQEDRYYSLQFVSEKLGCNVNTVLNLLGSVVVQMEDNDSKIADALDIGLNIINRSQSLLVPELVRLNQADQYAKGYSKYQQFKDLELSEKCVSMLCEYRNQCPRIQQFINSIKENLKNITIKSSDLFTKSPDPNIDLLKLYIWILKLPESQYLLQGISSKVAMLKINKKVQQMQFKKEKKINQGFAVQESFGTYLPPFFTKHPTIHRIGDRVVNLKYPFGVYGTVVGLLDKDEILVQVLWDEKYIGFTNLGGRYDLLQCSTCKFTDVFNLSNEDWISSLAAKGQNKGESWDLYTKTYMPSFKSKPIEENKELTENNPFQQLKELPVEPKPKVLVKEKEKEKQDDIFLQLAQSMPDKVTTAPLQGISEQEIIKEQIAQQQLQQMFQEFQKYENQQEIKQVLEIDKHQEIIQHEQQVDVKVEQQQVVEQQAQIQYKLQQQEQLQKQEQLLKQEQQQKQELPQKQELLQKQELPQKTEKLTSQPKKVLQKKKD